MDISSYSHPGKDYDDIDDIGDGPAKAVVYKNQEARMTRQVKETKAQLEKINDRVQFSLSQYELNDEKVNDLLRSQSSMMMEQFKDEVHDTNLEFVDDMNELLSILLNPIAKQKYQQYVNIFVVGYESKCGNRLQLLSQINDSFCSYEYDNIPEMAIQEFDVDIVGNSVKASLDKATIIQKKLQDISQNVLSVLSVMNPTKMKLKSKKNTERALLESKESLLAVTDKLLTAQQELQNNNEKIGQIYRTLEVKQVEIERLKTQVEASKNKSSTSAKYRTELSEKDKDLLKLKKENSQLKIDLEQYQHSISTYEEKQKTSLQIQKKMEMEYTYEIEVLKEQIIKSRKNNEESFENKMLEMKNLHELQLNEEKKKRTTNTTELQETIHHLKDDLARAVQLKDDIVNQMMTEQAKQELNNKDTAFNSSVEKMVKSHKEIKDLTDQNRKLTAKLKFEEQLKEGMLTENQNLLNENEKKENAVIIKVRSFEVETQTEDEKIEEEANDEAEGAIAQLEKLKSSRKTAKELEVELEETRSKFNQNINLVTKLMQQKQKYIKQLEDLSTLLAQSKQENEETNVLLADTKIKMEEFKLLYQEAMNNTQNDLDFKRPTTRSAANSPIIPIIEEQENVSPDNNDSLPSTINERPSSEQSHSSEKSINDEKKAVEILETVLDGHGIVDTMSTFYTDILLFKEQMIKAGKSDILLSDDLIPLETIKLKNIETTSRIDQLEAIVGNAIDIIGVIRNLLPVLIGEDDRINDSLDARDDVNSSISIQLEEKPPVPSTSQDLLSPCIDMNTQTNTSYTPHNSRSSNRSKLVHDYKMLLDEHTTLEQDFQRLREEYQVTQLAHENVVTQNYDVIGQLDTTIVELKEQLKNALSSKHGFLKPEEFIFTRNDREYNERVLRQHNQLSMGKADELQKVMNKYTSVPVQRWLTLTRRYLHHRRMKEIEQLIKSPKFNVTILLNQMEKLQSQRALNWMTSSDELSKERIELANILLERLHTVEKETGIFLIKPYVTLQANKNKTRSSSKKPLSNHHRVNKKYVGSLKINTKKLAANQTEQQSVWIPNDVTGNQIPDSFEGLTRIPKILEMDVNRSMFSDNLISTPLPKSRYVKNGDNQLNLISYMTVDRSVAISNNMDQFAASDVFSIQRPHSLPALYGRISVTNDPIDLVEETNAYQRRSALTSYSDSIMKTLTPLPAI